VTIWQASQRRFKCPCHGSGFYADGRNFEGPAPRALDRYAIRLTDDGQLEIDTSRTFQAELGQWNDPASYVPADRHFAELMLRPDNVSIVAMVYLLGFFTWLGAAQAVENDRRHEQGRPPVEHEFREETLVWPDLVYIELICALLVSAALIVWSMVLRAPLEQPANPAVTPNPAKAPWYFLGLQELLVFFDPAMGGVVLPTLIILGLMAIPYLDSSPKGTGYYTIILGRTLLRSFRRQMGGGRYWIMVLLLLMMIAVPLKMLLRWTCNLSYVVSMPEYFFNF